LGCDDEREVESQGGFAGRGDAFGGMLEACLIGNASVREPRCELCGDVHPFGQLEPDRLVLGVIDGVHHIDRQTALVEDVRDPDLPELEAVASSEGDEMMMSRSL
jgi:hypothetical protein